MSFRGWGDNKLQQKQYNTFFNLSLWGYLLESLEISSDESFWTNTWMEVMPTKAEQLSDRTWEKI